MEADKLYHIKTNKMRHTRIPTGEIRYECDICQKTFSRSWSLVKHKRRIHTGKKYECEICQNTFSRGGSLVIHKSIHTLVKSHMNVMFAKSLLLLDVT